MSEASGFAGWAILELMGHRKLGGRLSEQEIAGQAFVRIDVEDGAGPVATQFYSAQAVYAITPTTEQIAKAVAAYHRPAPVVRWELRALDGPRTDDGDEGESTDDDPW